MPKKKRPNPAGYAKACISRLKRLLIHRAKAPNDTKHLRQIADKIVKCREGTYRK